MPNKHYTFLDQINNPNDLKKIPHENLDAVAKDIRDCMIDAVSQTGGHLGAGLGVVELTIALHYVFNTPEDKIIWDVGHQAYPHKILTERKDRIHTLRQGGGLSGFTKRSESIYDPFGAAHSSTSISSALGMAIARDLKHDDNHVIAVIGDGAMSAGMAYEAMNNAGALKSRLIVILNDNDMSIAPPVGAMSNYLAKLWSGKSYQSFRDVMRKVTSISSGLERAAKRIEEYTKGMAVGGTLFEELGFHYYGPIDGHNLETLIPILNNLKNSNSPVLLHIVTQKGKGYLPAEQAKDKYHGVNKFNPCTGEQKKSTSTIPSYTKVFADSLLKEAQKDDKIIAITAAMPDGTGLIGFQKQFPKRCFDVGIAEQHAVTFAAGLACEGFKPFVTIYSTFLQRAYDQIVHDVAIQNLPVRFAIDRAGLVGADGATHAGSFDIAYLGCLPNFILMAAANEIDLQNMVTTAALMNEQPIAFRYPRGEGVGLVMPEQGVALPIGKGEIVKQGNDIAIFSYGTRLSDALIAADFLEKEHNISVTIANARFAKPLDIDMLQQLSSHHSVFITIEEGSGGGFGAIVLQTMAHMNLLDGRTHIIPMYLPDVFQDHNTPHAMYDEARLNAHHIIDKVLSLGLKKQSKKLSLTTT